MRVFLSGNEEVARLHLPVAKSMATEFAKRTEKRGLKQNAFSVLFKETGARAAMTYAFGEINLSVDAPFSGKVEEGVLIQERRLYEWNKVAEIDRVCRGERGAMLGVNQAFLCAFDAEVIVVVCGSISVADESIPESMRTGAIQHQMYQTRRYINRIDDMFFAWRLDYFSYSYVNTSVPVYVASQGLFMDSAGEYGYTQLFRMDEIYVSGSPVKSARLPSDRLSLTAAGDLILYETAGDGIVHSPDVEPTASTSLHPGSDIFDPQESVYWTGGDGGAGGLWKGDSTPIAPMRGEAIAHFTGTTAQGALVNQYSTYDPPDNPATDTYLNMYASTITLNLIINYVDSLNVIQTSSFQLLNLFTVTDPSFNAYDCVYSKARAYTTLGGESTYENSVAGTMLKTGNYAYTLKGADIQYIGPHVFVSLTGAAPLNDLFVRSGDTFTAYTLTNTTGYALKGTPEFGRTAASTALEKEIGIVESSFDGMSFIGCKYYEEKTSDTTIGLSHHVGVYEFADDGSGGVTLTEHMLFVETGEAQGSNRKVYFWFSENYEAIVLKGTAAHDGVWVKSSGAYSRILSSMSGYTEPVYISKDGSVVALKDKIYVNGLLAVEPAECVGVFHTHDYFVDKISAAQFAIKDMLGNVVSTTQDGLYNFYELTEDSSYAVLSKTWWEEEDDKSTDVALVVGFADGPIKFETADQPVLRQMDPSSPRVSPRFESTSTYFWPTTWARAYMPATTTWLIYSKQSSRTLVSCREDGFAERAHNFSEEERVSAFLWHPELGLLQRFLNTTTEIPESLLRQRTETRFEEE